MHVLGGDLFRVRDAISNPRIRTLQLWLCFSGSILRRLFTHSWSFGLRLVSTHVNYKHSAWCFRLLIRLGGCPHRVGRYSLRYRRTKPCGRPGNRVRPTLSMYVSRYSAVVWADQPPARSAHPRVEPHASPAELRNGAHAGLTSDVDPGSAAHSRPTRFSVVVQPLVGLQVARFDLTPGVNHPRTLRTSRVRRLGPRGRGGIGAVRMKQGAGGQCGRRSVDQSDRVNVSSEFRPGAERLSTGVTVVFLGCILCHESLSMC